MLPPKTTGTTTYECYKDGVIIEGADEAAHIINPVSHDDAGEYQLRITDQSKRIYLNKPVTLTVLDAVPEGGPLFAAGLAAVLLSAFLLTGKKCRSIPSKRSEPFA